MAAATIRKKKARHTLVNRTKAKPKAKSKAKAKAKSVTKAKKSPAKTKKSKVKKPIKAKKVVLKATSKKTIAAKPKTKAKVKLKTKKVSSKSKPKAKIKATVAPRQTNKAIHEITNNELIPEHIHIQNIAFEKEEQPTEPYMSEEQIDHFKNMLEQWKRELMEEVDHTITEMKEATVLADPNDCATQEETFTLELRTRDRERRLLKKIEEALRKIDEEEYGYCEACGIEIGILRLEARPTATLCIDCKTLDEIKEKRS